jgi:5-methylcytosine-specific restriction endonuclease McrBC regulatory subunit McrC
MRGAVDESGTTVLDETSANQVGAMQALLEDRYFTLSESPRGMTFSARDCVGQINLRNGSVLNILPEIPGLKTDADPGRILIEMLYSVFGMETKREDYANLFEFCVKIFIDTVNRLIRRGLRSKYHSVEGNEKAFKGRIMFNEHIRQNFIHKERIYVEYETYSQDRPENRLIKSTMEALIRRTEDGRNKKGLKSLVAEMEEIPSSDDVDRDFSRCVMDRNMVDYEGPMVWCNIFLKGMGLAGASGTPLPFALLIKADALFGAYVARKSSVRREDGSFLIKYGADIRTDGGSSGVSVITIDLDWSFYNRVKNTTERDAEMMFMSAPGYRVIPRAIGTDRLMAMARSYLADSLV